MGPKIIRLKDAGIMAALHGIDVWIQYEGEPVERVTFVGTPYGEPGRVVLITPNGVQTPVSNPERYGATFNADWVRHFFSDGEL